tara:strand:+ start:72 stop:842 length:771 start_codon:yes stop_codon:yes gene_type:complete
MTVPIVMFSGGIGSWATAGRMAAKYGADKMILLFADTKMEDEDLYRFLNEAAADVGGELVIETEGRDPWQVFRDVKFLGNSRVDPCSRILKRQLLRQYIESHHAPGNTVIGIGFDWTEAHRFERAKKHWAPWRIEAPMLEAPYHKKSDLLRMLEVCGITPPRLYEMGFPHNNCGGFCIKAGQAHFANLLANLPERYAYHERKEQELRSHLGKNIAILRDRRDGKTKPLTLKAFRESIEDGVQPDMFEWGGCGCFAP